ncbi:hypothetical protein F2P81_003502 [Scophthalmus maximus]|uniref:Uncharacterized protein n=1 Tax=Scophthalmus maximus TaxID=52904 RepID=A0A6A4TMB1_SCOMX|nr:hypothetical protein F2P81_003502 [Scophthalmus maximus]
MRSSVTSFSAEPSRILSLPLDVMCVYMQGKKLKEEENTNSWRRREEKKILIVFAGCAERSYFRIKLIQGQCTWRHDQVLRSLADPISTAVQNTKNQYPLKRSKIFISVLEKAQHKPNSSGGILAFLLAAPSRPREAAQVPGKHYDHFDTYDAILRIYEARGLGGTNCPQKTGYKKPMT